MRFVAALDTRIHGVTHLQGSEVDVSGWERRELLQMLGLGVIQAASVTAGSLQDSLEFVGDGVTTEVDGDGVLVVTFDIPAPSLATLPDVDLTVAPTDGQGLKYVAADGKWKAGAVAGGGGGAFAGCKLTTTAGQTVPSNAFTALTWNGELYDTDGYHSGSSSRITIPAGKAGKYWIHARYHYETGSAQNFIISIAKNGVNLEHTWSRDGSQSYPGIETSTSLDLAVGDYIEVLYYGPSGSMSQRAEFEAFLIGGAPTVVTDDPWQAPPPGWTTIDEFSGGTLDPAWARVDSGSGAARATWSQKYGRLAVKNAGGDANSELHCQMRPLSGVGGALVDGDAIVIGHRHIAPAASNYAMTGIVLADGVSYGSGSQVLTLSYTTSSFLGMVTNDTRGFTGYNTQVTASASLQTPPGMPYFSRLVKLAGNQWRHDISQDGDLWVTGTAYARTITPTHVGMLNSTWAEARQSLQEYLFMRRMSGVT